MRRVHETPGRTLPMCQFESAKIDFKVQLTTSKTAYGGPTLNRGSRSDACEGCEEKDTSIIASNSFPQ